MAQLFLTQLDDTKLAVSELQNTITAMEHKLVDAVANQEFDKLESRVTDLVSCMFQSTRALKILGVCLRCTCVCFDGRIVLVLHRDSRQT